MLKEDPTYGNDGTRRWVGMRERISNGTRLMGAKVFFLSRTTLSAVEISRSS